MNRPLWNTLWVGIVSAAGLASGGIALAQDPAGPASGPALGQCKDDITKLCAGVAAGGGRLLKCLSEHRAELSAPCKAAMKAGPPPAAAAPGAPPPPPPAAAVAPAKAGPEGGPGPRAPKGAMGKPAGKPAEWGAIPAMRRSCAAEIAQSCKDVKPGHGRIATCLNEHPQDLKPKCKAAVDQVTAQLESRMETHNACEPDVQRLCNDVPPGTGRAAVCLGEHNAELAPECKREINKMKAGWGKRDFGLGRGKGPAAAPAGGPPPAPPAAGGKPPTPPAPAPGPSPAPPASKPATPPPPPPPPPAK